MLRAGRVKDYRQWEVVFRLGRFTLRANIHGYWRGVGLHITPWFDPSEDEGATSASGGLAVGIDTLYSGVEAMAYIAGQDEFNNAKKGWSR